MPLLALRRARVTHVVIIGPLSTRSQYRLMVLERRWSRVEVSRRPVDAVTFAERDPDGAGRHKNWSLERRRRPVEVRQAQLNSNPTATQQRTNGKEPRCCLPPNTGALLLWSVP